GRSAPYGQAVPETLDSCAPGCILTRICHNSPTRCSSKGRPPPATKPARWLPKQLRRAAGLRPLSRTQGCKEASRAPKAVELPSNLLSLSREQTVFRNRGQSASGARICCDSALSARVILAQAPIRV